MTTYTAAVATASDVTADDFCDVSVVENLVHGYTVDDDGNETPDYTLSDKMAMEPVKLDVRTDDDDVLGHAVNAAESVLGAQGWRICGQWDTGDNAMYAAVERA